jgi:hypothetical protein
MPIWANCGEAFKAKRADARLCSTRCRVAAHRASVGSTTAAQDARVTDNPTDSASARSNAPLRLPHSAQGDPRLSGEPFPFDKDTISGRTWRVLDGWLEVEAMVAGSRCLRWPTAPISPCGWLGCPAPTSRLSARRCNCPRWP